MSGGRIANGILSCQGRRFFCFWGHRLGFILRCLPKPDQVDLLYFKIFKGDEGGTNFGIGSRFSNPPNVPSLTARAPFSLFLLLTTKHQDIGTMSVAGFEGPLPAHTSQPALRSALRVLRQLHNQKLAPLTKRSKTSTSWNMKRWATARLCAASS